MNDILEIQFQLTYNLHISFSDFDKMEFYELIWLYERVADEKHKENEAENSNRRGIPISKMLESGRIPNG